MKKLLLAVLFTVFAAEVANAQTSTLISMQASPTTCGKATTPLICNRVPVTVQIDGKYNSGGSFWLDIYPSNNGFVAFNIPNFQTIAHVTGATRTFNSIGQITQIVITFEGQADPDSDNDADTFLGSMTLNFSYYYSNVGRLAGWYLKVASGTVTVASN